MSTEPRTEAGKALLNMRRTPGIGSEVYRRTILAIEDEARADLLAQVEQLRKALHDVSTERPDGDCWCWFAPLAAAMPDSQHLHNAACKQARQALATTPQPAARASIEAPVMAMAAALVQFYDLADNDHNQWAVNKHWPAIYRAKALLQQPEGEP